MSGEVNIEERVKEFRVARDWPKTDTAENLIAALIIEAEEVREDIETSGIIPPKPHSAGPRPYSAGRESFDAEVHRGYERREELSSHVADIGIYFLTLCGHLDIDFSRAIDSKMEKLDDKYPTPLGKTRRDLQEGGGITPQFLPLDHLLELWGDEDICDWGEVARNLSDSQKDEIFWLGNWNGIMGIARNLDPYNPRRYALLIIESGIPNAIEELLTYDDLHSHELTRDEIIRGIKILRANLKNKGEDTPYARANLHRIEERYGFLKAPL